MALVFTTFFIMGLGYVFAEENLGRIVGRRAAWFAFWLGAAGSVAAAVTILLGQSTVLYTFYPPLQAHPLFYIGATLLVIASWIWGAVVIASYRSWRREHPGVPAPLAIHGMLATIVIWYLATTGLAIEVLGMLIPWSLGWVQKIDPLLARIVLLVVRAPAGVLLAAAGLRALVHGAAERGGRPVVQRPPGADGVHPVRAALDAGRVPPSVRGSRASARAGSSRTRSRPTRFSIRAS